MIEDTNFIEHVSGYMVYVDSIVNAFVWTNYGRKDDEILLFETRTFTCFFSLKIINKKTLVN
jgi:hypothetical protein